MIKHSVCVCICLLVASSAFAQTTVVFMTNPPATQAVLTTFVIGTTVKNNTTGPMGSSTLTFSLITVSGTTVMTLGNRPVPSLSGGAISTATSTIAIPGNVNPGTYVIGAGSSGCPPSNCVKSTGTIVITAPPPTVTVTVTVLVYGYGTVMGGRETGFYQNQYFQSCNQPASNSGACKTSGPGGTAFVLTPTPGTVPASGPFGQSHPAQFMGWTGCNGTNQGNNGGLRVVANTSITCKAQFSQ